jgi:hypothetical protein
MYENIKAIRATRKVTVSIGPGETWQGEGIFIGNAYVTMTKFWVKTDKNAEFKWYASTDGVTLGFNHTDANTVLTGGTWEQDFGSGHPCTQYNIPTIKNTSGDTLTEIEIYVFWRWTLF